MLQTNNLSYFINGRRILDHVSFQINSGEFVGLMGPNGSGKTTLIKILSGAIRNYEGSATLHLLHINRLKPRGLSQTLAVVPQEAHFAFPFTCLEVVLMGRHPFQKSFSFDSESDTQIAKRAMQKTDCWQFADRTLQTLSGGEKQRVLLARALSQKPKILLLDEPASHLDLKHQEALFGLLTELHQSERLTILCVIHDLKSASEYPERLLLLREGRLAIQGVTREVLTEENIRQVFDVSMKKYVPDTRRMVDAS